MQTITVIIHTHNEERNIVDCIDSALLLTSHVLVVDMESTDNTVTLAKAKNARVETFPPSQIVEYARNFAIDKAQSDWVFLLDSDERITPELATEIKKILAATPDSSSIISAPLSVIPDPPSPEYNRRDPESMGASSKPEILDQVEDDVSANSAQPATRNSQLVTHYRVPRKNIFGGEKWLQHGGWWPDYQTRLIMKSAFKNWPERIHATPEIDGKGGLLQYPIEHYFHTDLTTMVEKTAIFENIESALLYEAGREANTPIFFRKFSAELYRRLVKNAGWKDGDYGVIESIYQAFSKTITYLMLYEKNMKKS